MHGFAADARPTGGRRPFSEIETQAPPSTAMFVIFKSATHNRRQCIYMDFLNTDNLPPPIASNAIHRISYLVMGVLRPA